MALLPRKVVEEPISLPMPEPIALPELPEADELIDQHSSTIGRQKFREKLVDAILEEDPSL